MCCGGEHKILTLCFFYGYRETLVIIRGHVYSVDSTGKEGLDRQHLLV